jgi:hypothetical protein
VAAQYADDWRVPPPVVEEYLDPNEELTIDDYL